jgi:hypothetical protein
MPTHDLDAIRLCSTAMRTLRTALVLLALLGCDSSGPAGPPDPGVDPAMLCADMLSALIDGLMVKLGGSRAAFEAKLAPGAVCDALLRSAIDVDPSASDACLAFAKSVRTPAEFETRADNPCATLFVGRRQLGAECYPIPLIGPRIGECQGGFCSDLDRQCPGHCTAWASGDCTPTGAPCAPGSDCRFSGKLTCAPSLGPGDSCANAHNGCRAGLVCLCSGVGSCACQAPIETGTSTGSCLVEPRTSGACSLPGLLDQPCTAVGCGIATHCEGGSCVRDPVPGEACGAAKPNCWGGSCVPTSTAAPDGGIGPGLCQPTPDAGCGDSGVCGCAR